MTHYWEPRKPKASAPVSSEPKARWETKLLTEESVETDSFDAFMRLLDVAKNNLESDEYQALQEAYKMLFQYRNLSLSDTSKALLQKAELVDEHGKIKDDLYLLIEATGENFDPTRHRTRDRIEFWCDPSSGAISQGSKPSAPADPNA